MTDLTLPADVLTELDGVFEHYNASHADTVLFLVRHAADRPDADDAEIVAVDRLGAEFDIVAGGRRDRARLAFGEGVGTADEVSTRLYGHLAAARARVGDAVPLTTIEAELASTATRPTLVSNVAEVRDLTPNLREIVLEGGLERFESAGGDQFVYLMVGRDGGPDMPPDHTMADQMAGGRDEVPWAGAYYTIRCWDAERHRLTLWMVRHDHGDGVGGWVGRAQLGERVALWGPRHGFGGAPPGAESLLLVADESGFAAVAALIDEAPADLPITVLLETVDPDHTVVLPEREHVDVRWLFRGTDEPGIGTRLLDAVRALALPSVGVVAFGAGESRQVTAIRKHLRHERGLPAHLVSMTGYWRRTIEG